MAYNLFIFVCPVCPAYKHLQETGSWEVPSDWADLLPKLQGDGEIPIITHL